jgi:hypothetical protein
VQQTALQERPHEDPTIGILVVQVRRIRAISGDVFPRAAATFVTHDVVPEGGDPYTPSHHWGAGVDILL